MDIPTLPIKENDIYSYGFGKSLYRGESPAKSFNDQFDSAYSNKFTAIGIDNMIKVDGTGVDLSVERVTKLRIGNLKGFLGYEDTIYGIGVGESGDYLSYESTNGLNITGTITGGTIQTGTSGERVKLFDDSILIYDTNDIIRVATDNGMWIFWDGNGNPCGGMYGSPATTFFMYSYGKFTINANDGADVLEIVGTVDPNADATYDLGTRPYKWEYAYLDKNLRFDYAQANLISKIDDSDNEYTRIRFDASNGNIGLGRTIYPITNNSYDLGVTATNRWANVYMVGTVYFETTTNKGLVWDVAGDNAQFYYNNSSNYFYANKKLKAASFETTGNLTISGTVDGVDVSAFASSYNSHTTSISAHHNAYSHNYAITPLTVNGYTIVSIVNAMNALTSAFNTHAGAVDSHHDEYSNGYAITPFSVVSSAACNLAGLTVNGNLQPNASNTRYCGTSGAYWKRVYSDAYFTKNATFQMFDKYDDLQILRNLKFGKKNELLIENLPKEIQEEGFINFGGMTSFNLCASKKIVECVDDLKKELDESKIVIKELTDRLVNTEARLNETENLLAI